MAQDPFDMRMSRMLDGDLTQEERRIFEQKISDDAHFADAWNDFQVVDAMLRQQTELAPSFDLTAGVMARVEMYESRKAWAPWIVALGGLFILMMLFMFVTPWLIVSGILPSIIADVPIIGTIIVGIAQAMQYAVIGATIFADAIALWLQTLATDPLALGLVITALVLASTYIGLREGQRIYALALVEGQNPRS